jgi:GT2 family glycosyltransferase
MTSICAVLACYNRRDTTLRCLGSLEGQDGGHSVRAVVLDDASSDGTPEALSRFSWVEVLHGDGQRYWNGGMHDAFSAALHTTSDYILWINDDTHLDDDALQRMLTVAANPGIDATAIIVGTTRDPRSGQATYGGLLRDRPLTRPSRFRLIEPEDVPLRSDTMNGNCVLIPMRTADALGPNDPSFTHGLGDLDYGLHATRHGVPVIVAPGTVGTCARNPVPDPPAGALLQRARSSLQAKTAPTQLPPKDWARFLRRWGGPFWPLFFVSPYINAVIAAMANRNNSLRLPSRDATQ